MNAIIADIKHWLRANALPLLKVLNLPADENEINALQARQNLRFPPDVRQLYLFHNGESDQSDGIFGCMKMLSLVEIEQEIELIGENGIIPLFRSGGGDLYYVKSYNPAKPDLRLFEWWHEEPEEAKVISENVKRFLSDFNHQLQNGQFVYRPEELTALINRDEL